MIYGVQYNKQHKFCYAVALKDSFDLPVKIYGDYNKKALKVWNDYALNGSSGVLLTGDKGSGKSLLGNIISNIAISKNLDVYFIDGASFSDSSDEIAAVFSFLNTLTNCAVFIDEFGKLFYYSRQERLLTFLSDPLDSRRLIILTENRVGSINEYILNRPGRIKYHFNFEKLPSDVFLDYTKQAELDPDFYNDLNSKYETVNTFSFDQLEAICMEHKKYPLDTLDDILNSLNVTNLRTPVTYHLAQVIDKSTGEDVEFSPVSMVNEASIFTRDRYSTLSGYVKLKLDPERIKELKIPIIPNASGMFNPRPIENNNETNQYYNYSFEIKANNAGITNSVKTDDQIRITTDDFIIIYKVTKK